MPAVVAGVIISYHALALAQDDMWAANPSPWKLVAFVGAFSTLGGFWHMLWRWPTNGFRWQNAIGGIGVASTVGLIVTLIFYEWLKGTPTLLVGTALAFAFLGGEFFEAWLRRWASRIALSGERGSGSFGPPTPPGDDGGLPR